MTNPSPFPSAPEGDEALFRRKYVLFAATRLGAAFPWVFRPIHCSEVRSVVVEWPAWLPYIAIREIAPNMLAGHPHWPISVGDRAAPGARVSAIFTDDKIVRDIVFHRGWIDVSDRWHQALILRDHPPAPVAETPPDGPLQAVARIASGLVEKANGTKKRAPAVAP